MNRIRTLAPLLLLAALLTPHPAAAQFPADSTIRRMLAERVAKGMTPGIVVGIMEPAGSRVVAYGSSGVEGLPLDARTIFEIGSVTKTFTAALLADMVARGEVRLDEPVADLLPESVKVPSWPNRPITLLDLATHASSLPRDPSNLHPKDEEDPLAGYTAADLYTFLASYTLPHAPGTEVAYSNVGMGLLGHALALRAGKSYAELLRERILLPLGMNDTRIVPSAAEEKRLGHDEDGKPVRHWHVGVLAPAGALHSDVADLFHYLGANIGTSGGALIPVLAMTHAPRVPVNDTTSAGLAWVIDRADPAHPFWWHNGTTGGFQSFVAFDPAAKLGIVVLSNGRSSIDDIGMRLLAAARRR